MPSSENEASQFEKGSGEVLIASRLPALHGTVGFVVQRQQTGAVVQQHLARRRKLQTLALTHEQLDAELFLHLLEAR